MYPLFSRVAQEIKGDVEGVNYRIVRGETQELTYDSFLRRRYVLPRKRNILGS